MVARVPLVLGAEPLRVHLVGIGGAGMSAIAEVLCGLGHTVSGSDRAESAMLERLRSHGIDAVAGHDPENVTGVDYVGVSTAIDPSNPEIERARELGIPVGHRFDLLAAIGSTSRTVSISGTHGKTTTSALTALAFDGAGADPSFIIGGDVAGFGAGARWTGGEWLILEADESDSTFLAPPRAAAVVTNIEADHLDHHGSFDALVAAFRTFVAETSGPSLICVDDLHAASLRAEFATDRSVAGYGTSDGAEYQIVDVANDRAGATWSVVCRDGSRHELSLGLPGMHLVRNATAAFAIAVELGLDPQKVAGGIARYQGVGRRFERRGEVAGVTLIDDYAHLPTEVRAVLSAASVGDWGRVVCVFQPHRFSRTAAIWPEYADAFDGADVLVLTEIYAAGETPIDGMSGALIVDAVRKARPAQDVRWSPTRATLIADLSELLQPGDLCLTLGAGDLTTLPDDLLEAMKTPGVGGV